MENSRISIIGLGLIGGSLARAFRERLKARRIIAVNDTAGPLEEAVADGSIDRGYTSLNEEVFASDLIFICTPVRDTVRYVQLLAGNLKPGCILTDVGSTKSEIVRRVDAISPPVCFIGGHPMAGMEKTGYMHGRAHLFENAYYILTPGGATTGEALEALQELVRGIGAIPVLMEPDEHDRVTGGLSHVPHIIASALVNLVRAMDSPDGNMKKLAAGGFRDITRIASSSPEMWESVVFSNRDKVVSLLDDFTDIIKKVREDITGSRNSSVLDFFESARAYRNSLSSSRQGLISPSWEVVVDVVDRPGIIGGIATILGNGGVNIGNINVSNSREFEQGCLRITLPDSVSCEAAYKLLKGSGYKVYKRAES